MKISDYIAFIKQADPRNRASWNEMRNAQAVQMMQMYHPGYKPTTQMPLCGPGSQASYLPGASTSGPDGIPRGGWNYFEDEDEPRTPVYPHKIDLFTDSPADIQRKMQENQMINMGITSKPNPEYPGSGRATYLKLYNYSVPSRNIPIGTTEMPPKAKIIVQTQRDLARIRQNAGNNSTVNNTNPPASSTTWDALKSLMGIDQSVEIPEGAILESVIPIPSENKQDKPGLNLSNLVDKDTAAFLSVAVPGATIAGTSIPYAKHNWNNLVHGVPQEPSKPVYGPPPAMDGKPLYSTRVNIGGTDYQLNFVKPEAPSPYSSTSYNGIRGIIPKDSVYWDTTNPDVVPKVDRGLSRRVDAAERWNRFNDTVKKVRERTNRSFSNARMAKIPMFQFKPRAEGASRVVHLGKNALKTVGNFGAGMLNMPQDTVQALGHPVEVRPSLLNLPFAAIGPLQDSYNHIVERAQEAAINDGLDLSEGSPDQERYVKEYLNPRLKKDWYGANAGVIPGVITELMSFSNPLANVNFLADMGVNMPAGLLGQKKDVIPGLYKVKQHLTRYPTPSEIQEMREYAKREGFIDEDDPERTLNDYYLPNWATETGATWLQPLLEWPFAYTPWTKWIYDSTIRNGYQLFHGISKEPIITHDVNGNEQIDWQDFIFGKSFWEQRGGRPGLETDEGLSYTERDHRDLEMTQHYQDYAAALGYTAEEIEEGLRNFKHPNSLKIKAGNQLPLMAASVQRKRELIDEDLRTFSTPIPRFINKVIPTMNIPLYLNPDMEEELEEQNTEENPEWREAYFKYLRRFYDQRLLMEMEPFLAEHKRIPDGLIDKYAEALGLSPEYFLQLTDSGGLSFSELKLMTNKDSISDLLEIEQELEKNNAPISIAPISQQTLPYSSDLQAYWNYGPEQEQQRALDKYSRAYTLREISKMPAEARFLYMAQHPYLLEPFLEQYYSNDLAKQEIRNFVKLLAEKRKQMQNSTLLEMPPLELD